jgi:serpin B
MKAPGLPQFTRRTLLKGSAVALPGFAAGARFSAASDQHEPSPDLVDDNSTFALDLYAELRQAADNEGRNIFFSPYSVSQALAMVYAGAAGETAGQMADTLSFMLDQPELHEAFSKLNDDLIERGNSEGDPDAGDTARSLHIANALWGEQTYPFSNTYIEDLEQFYGAGLQQTDFINEPEDARDEINDWVADQTQDRIQDIVPEGNITSETRLVLANAIYFASSWYTPFWEDGTEDDDFFLLDDSTVTASFMFLHDHLPYAAGDGFEAVQLAYAGADYSPSGFAFTVIMPDEGEFESFEEGLDADVLSDVIDQLSSTEIRLYLPKFTFEFDASLADTLQTMGMTDAFDPSTADFSGMVEGAPPEPLYIGAVLHKAFVSIDEKGTEAAAATVVEMAAGAAPPEEEPPDVRINRPFLFAIRDTESGTLLFLGRVLDPSV